MSGGFFRGTSADQDTRFSNKQAKLLKSQKFAPELDHLVDSTKVKMDVIRPWIANRVTELLGFEDEVLINFIYGLLDGKEVNGKEIQISITGFMEKNTGKFMKELWTLLLSAQKNASSVPQQFLDAKEEEIRKKKEEADIIANEIQKKREKENKEFALDRLNKMDGRADKEANSALEATLKNALPRASSDHLVDAKESDTLNGQRGRHRSSPSRSLSRSFSNSRSNSESPEAPYRKRHHSPQRRSSTPHQRDSHESLSPRQRSPYQRRRSRSPFHRRSPSPLRRRLRSPFQRRSRSPIRRRSPSPVRRRRSPTPIRRRRSPTPIRHRKSPTPIRRRRTPSPAKRGRSPSPARRRRSPSPAKRGRSPSPARRRRSPSPARRRRLPSPVRRRRSPSPMRRRTPPARRGRSRSPEQYRSPSPIQGRSQSPVQGRDHRSPSTPPRKSPSPVRQRAPVPISRRSALSPHRSSPYEYSSPSAGRETSSTLRRTSTNHHKSPVQSPKLQIRSSRMSSPTENRISSPVRTKKEEQNDRSKSQRRHQETSLFLEKSPGLSGSSPGERKAAKGRRSSSHSESPVRLDREKIIQISDLRETKAHLDSLKLSKEMEEPKQASDLNSRSYQKTSTKPVAVASLKDSNVNVDLKENSPRTHLDGKELKKKDHELKSQRKALDEKSQSNSKKVKDSDGLGPNIVAMVDEKAIVHNERSGSFDDSDSEDEDKVRSRDAKKRKHKRRQKVASASDYSSDSGQEERKEAKRRKKEERRMRKEKKRERREKRRQIKEERVAGKPKGKNHGDKYSSDDNKHNARKKLHTIDEDEAESEEKKLEIKLREKAIESFKARRGGMNP